MSLEERMCTDGFCGRGRRMPHPTRISFMSPLAVVVVAVVVVLTAASAVRGELPDAAGVGGSAWRSADALHPIQAEMQPYVREMVSHAFDSYIKYAFPKDELRSVSGSGKNTMGGYGWTLIDSLDTLAVAGFHTEFRRYARWVEENVNFDIDVSVSLFETTIRALGDCFQRTSCMKRVWWRLLLRSTITGVGSCDSPWTWGTGCSRASTQLRVYHMAPLIFDTV
ncbi:Glycoside hydrolase family 47 [Trypanosoma melophagium]|uniref:Glycoside hydrolase family 47 n=1 Tax=Trypanosoma melophagium TaxID=715481 RepID=UPI00351A4253|nr:Glycoside hydrolase family 47 [Trypanosoma melophagium]